MGNKLSRFGVGPRIFISAALYAVVASLVTYLWPEVCLIRAVAYRFFLVPGVILMTVGIPIWLFAVVSVMRAYNRDQLVTSGAFAYCRHPVYSAWILFLLPGSALLTTSWPIMFTPLVAYLMFRRLIRTEDDYLRERFGKAYTEYRAKVNELAPLPR